MTVKEVMEIHDFYTLKEFGSSLATKSLPMIGAATSREKLAGLTAEQQDATMALFKKRCSILSDSSFNLGYIKNNLHHINTGI
ncbi:hypothetical protein DSO57_1020783, partial [Entomophthora muscae]